MLRVDFWGSSASDVFAVGYKGTVLHYDGNTWSEMIIPGGRCSLIDIWGSSSSDVFATGLEGTICCDKEFNLTDSNG